MATTVEPPFNNYIKAVQSFCLNAARSITLACFGCCVNPKKRNSKYNKSSETVALRKRDINRDPYNIFYSLNHNGNEDDNDSDNELERLLNQTSYNGNNSINYNSADVSNATFTDSSSAMSADSKLNFPQNFLKLFNWYSDDGRSNNQKLHSIRLNKSDRSAMKAAKLLWSTANGSSAASTSDTSLSSRAFLLEGINDNNMADNSLVEDSNFEGLITRNSSKSTFSF